MVNIRGRDDALRLLADATAEAQAGRGGLVMVRADPGMGVTTVLNAHASAVRGTGLRTRRIHVLPPDGSTSLSGGAPEEWPEPALIVVDDLHRADDATLLALHDLVEGLADRSILVVAGRHRGVAPARFALLDRHAVVHDLPPLDVDAVQDVLAELTGGDVPESLASLAEGANGNPWLLARLLDADRAATVTAWAADLAGGDTALLRFLALLDGSASMTELAAVADRASADVFDGVTRLAAVGLVDDTAGLVRMRYPVMCEDLALTSEGLRGSVARVLADRGALPGVVAGQLARTPVDRWAVEWLADHAERLAASPTPEVVDLLLRVVAWLPPGDPQLPPMRAALAEALLWSGRFADSRRTVAASLVAHPEPLLRQRLRSIQAEASLSEFDFGSALEILARERVDGVLPLRLAAMNALACLLAGDLDGAARAVEQAGTGVSQDPLVEVALLDVEAIGLCVSRDLAGAMERLDRAEALLDITVVHRGLWLMSRLLRAVVHDLRRDETVVDILADARPVAEQLGAGLLAWLHTIAALTAFNDGRWDDSLAEIAAAMAMPDQYGLARPLHGVAAVVLLHRGDLPAAGVHVELANQSDGRGVAVFYEQITLVADAQFAHADGDSQRALEIVRNIADGSVGVHHGHTVSAVGAPLVRIAVDGGDRELAERLVAEMRQWSSGESLGENGVLTYCEGLVNGDVDALLASAKSFSESGSPIAAARAAEDAAMVLATSGKSAEAKSIMREVIDRYTAFNATGDIHRANAAFRMLGMRRGATGPRRRPKHGWESLTEAEYRVAELVAQGCTNKEIAKRLIVSVRTVHSHVSRILSKVGCSSRVEIALKFQPRH